MSEASTSTDRAALFESFKGSISLGKSRIEASSVLRSRRYEAFLECAHESVQDATEEGVGLDEATKSFFDREATALRYKRHKWSVDDFNVVCELGAGSFGTVHLVTSKSSEGVFALKQMKKHRYQRKNYRERAFAERDLLGQADSRWFVGLVATFQDVDDVYMIMEFIQGGELFTYLELKGHLSTAETRFYMAELLVALEVVHKYGFVHRDVKPDNIMLTASGHLKLLDFGLCKHEVSDASEVELPPNASRRDRMQSKVGTPHYMSPEAFEGMATASSDLWALGIVLFECLYGSTPFHAGSKEGMEAIATIRALVKNFARVLPKRFAKARACGLMPPDAEALLTRIIQLEDDRLDAEAIRREPFFQGIDFEHIHEMEPAIRPEVSGEMDVSLFQGSDRRVDLPPSRRPRFEMDRALEWTHYEFDREADELERPEAVRDIFAAPTNSSPPSPVADATLSSSLSSTRHRLRG